MNVRTWATQTLKCMRQQLNKCLIIMIHFHTILSAQNAPLPSLPGQLFPSSHCLAQVPFVWASFSLASPALHLS